MSRSVAKSPGAAADGPAVPRDAVPAVLRAAQILDTLTEQREPLALAELTRRLDLPKSSVLGLCNTLASTGLVTRHSDGRFGLGVHLVDLAHAYLAGVDLTQEFNNLWDSMHEPPKEGVVLAVLDASDVVYVACRNGEIPLGVAYRIGMRLPASCTATGKVLLSTLPDARIRELYRGGKLPRLTRHSRPSLKALLEDLAETRARGYAIDDQETREGMMCIGAPGFDASGSQAVAAVAVSMLKYPGDAHQFDSATRTVREIARVLSRRLGAVTRAAP